MTRIHFFSAKSSVEKYSSQLVAQFFFLNNGEKSI